MSKINVELALDEAEALVLAAGAVARDMDGFIAQHGKGKHQQALLAWAKLQSAVESGKKAAPAIKAAKGAKVKP